MNGIKVFDLPKFLIDDPSEHVYSVVIPRGDDKACSIYLSNHGVTFRFQQNAYNS